MSFSVVMLVTATSLPVARSRRFVVTSLQTCVITPCPYLHFLLRALDKTLFGDVTVKRVVTVYDVDIAVDSSLVRLELPFCVNVWKVFLCWAISGSTSCK